MRHPAMRTTVVAVLVLGFLSIWASIALDWPAVPWIAPVGHALLVLGVAIGLVRVLARRRRHSRGPATELSASDDYSDFELGRRPITHYPRDAASTSQIGEPLQHPSSSS